MSLRDPDANPSGPPAMFLYQILLRYNYQLGNHNGQVQWILDML